MSNAHTPTKRDFELAWDFYRAHQDYAMARTQHYHEYRAEFIRGWNSEIAAAEQRGAIKSLRRVAKDLEWLGAQGNIPTPDTSWQGVLDCIRIINSEALTIEYRADRMEGDDE